MHMLVWLDKKRMYHLLKTIVLMFVNGRKTVRTLVYLSQSHYGATRHSLCGMFSQVSVILSAQDVFISDSRSLLEVVGIPVGSYNQG